MNRVINIGILLLLILFISFRVNVACNELRSNKSGDELDQVRLPVIFTGTLLCDYCPDIQYTLTLKNDRYIENSASIAVGIAPVQIEGRWELKSDTLYIYNENDLPVKRFLWNEDEIALLDQNNAKISSFTLRKE